MPQRKSLWPTYTARLGGEGCGHQHKTKIAAIHCAESRALRHPGRVVSVVLHRRNGSVRYVGDVTAPGPGL